MTAVEIDWWQGGGAPGGWIAFITLLVPTFIANVGTFLLITYSPRLNKSSTPLLVRYLAVEDAGFALLCLIQCCVNMSHGELVGHQTGCNIQAVYLVFFALSTGYTLCVIAYNSEQKIGYNKGLSSNQVFYVHVVIWTGSAALALIGSLVIEPARLVPSGTYCLTALNKAGPAILIMLTGPTVIFLFLAHRYYLMFKHIANHTNAVLNSWEQHRLAARARQIQSAKRMLLLILVYVVTYFPEIILNLVEIQHGRAPSQLHIFTGSLVHFNSFLNPVLYVYMNASMRTALKDAVTFRSDRVVKPFPLSPRSGKVPLSSITTQREPPVASPQAVTRELSPPIAESELDPTIPMSPMSIHRTILERTSESDDEPVPGFAAMT